MDDGTFQSNELHHIWEALHQIPQCLGSCLMDHIHTQAHATTKISVGGMVTAITKHLGVQINEEPISLNILLDRTTLNQRRMILHDANPCNWLWLFHQSNEKFIFPLPNLKLTKICGENATVRWMMTTPQHVALMRWVSERNRRGTERLEEAEDEQVEEKDAYEQGGVQPHQEAAQEPFQMQAPDFEGFEQRFYSHINAHHNAQMASHDNYYMMQRRYMEE